MPGRTPPAPVSVLFIGNSLTYWNGGIDAWVAKHTNIRTSKVTLPGASLQTLWRAGKASEAIKKGSWDAVVLQEDLPESTERNFLDFGSKFISVIKEADAIPLLLMTWEYKRLDHMQQKDINNAHIKLAKEHGISVIPVGFAFEVIASNTMRKSGNFATLLGQDGEHPSEHGTVLASLMTIQVLAKTFNRASGKEVVLDIGKSQGSICDVDTLNTHSSACMIFWDQQAVSN